METEQGRAVDWEAVKAEYVTGNASMRQVAEEHGLSYHTLRYRCAVERWGDLRRQHRDRVLEKTSQRMSDRAADRMAQLMGGTDKMLDAALETLDDPQQFYRRLVKVKDDTGSHTREELFQKADTGAMKDMAALLEKLTGLTRDLYGLPTREQELREQLAKEKLELEQQKQAAGEQTRLEVVFQAGPEEWND